MKAAVSLALILLHMAASCAQDFLTLLTEEEYEKEKPVIQWHVENGYVSEEYRLIWERTLRELLEVKGLPSYTKTVNFKGKTKDELNSAISDVMNKKGGTDGDVYWYVSFQASGGKDWCVYTMNKINLGDVGLGCNLAVRFFINDGYLKIAVWKTDNCSDERQCKEIIDGLAQVMEFMMK